MAARLRGRYAADQKLVQVNVRLAPELKRRLLASSLVNGRTVQAEAAALLERGLAARA